jgi:PHD/YefM family antitoxin component YafN of YafNO toxin-antitoxin module
MDMIDLKTLKSRGANAIPEGKAVYLIVNSKPKAVLVPPEEYEMLQQALEDLEDLAAIEARKNEKAIPLEEAFPQF